MCSLEEIDRSLNSDDLIVTEAEGSSGPDADCDLPTRLGREEVVVGEGQHGGEGSLEDIEWHAAAPRATGPHTGRYSSRGVHGSAALAASSAWQQNEGSEASGESGTHLYSGSEEEQSLPAKHLMPPPCAADPLPQGRHTGDTQHHHAFSPSPPSTQLHNHTAGNSTSASHFLPPSDLHYVGVRGSESPSHSRSQASFSSSSSAQTVSSGGTSQQSLRPLDEARTLQGQQQQHSQDNIATNSHTQIV